MGSFAVASASLWTAELPGRDWEKSASGGMGGEIVMEEDLQLGMPAGIPLPVHIQGAGYGGVDEVEGLDGEIAGEIEGGAAKGEDFAGREAGEIDLGKDGVFCEVRGGIGVGARGGEAREEHAGENGGQTGTEHRRQG